MNRFKFKDRIEIADWLNRHDLVGSVAEIGCARGAFSEGVLNIWKGKRYFMVDPWERQSKDVYRERTIDVNYDEYWNCVQGLAQRDARVKLIRKLSTEGSEEVADGSLDWVFIDANHAYGPVLEDMDHWFPKLKSGGVFSGHDYGNDTNWPHWCEVKPAVDRWMREHGMDFEVCADSWWTVK